MSANKGRSLFNTVVLGGYGNFGAIIAAKLAASDGIDVIVAGRHGDKAGAYAQRIGARAAGIDAGAADLADHLRALEAQLVISAAGPFQGQNYRVARAAIDAGAHYIDIADARSFVCGISALNAAAKSRNVLVVSGASSVPALAAAVIDRYQPEFALLREIDHGISVAEKTPGPATVTAALGYCGKPIRQWRNGAWRTVYGWQNLRRYRFKPPLGPRWLGNCDVPDLELFPARYPTVRTVRFQAGLGFGLTQFGIWGLSWTVRAGLLKNAAVPAPALRRLAKAMEPFGSGRSGMFVKLSGLGHDNTNASRVWEMVAQHNHGLNIPCMAAVSLARKLAAGCLSIRGAVPCVGLITLDEYLDELGGLDIQWDGSLRPA